ncbi:MAG: hypothetical protein R2873_21870 [Caldilineaceae bacterium]
MLKPLRTLLISVAALVCRVSACRRWPALAQEDNADEVSWFDLLGNLTYPNEMSVHGEVTLEDGQFVDMADGLAVTLTGYIAAGDLNDDDVDDAAAVLVSDPDGTAIFIDLAAAIDVDGELMASPAPNSATAPIWLISTSKMVRSSWTWSPKVPMIRFAAPPCWCSALRTGR